MTFSDTMMLIKCMDGHVDCISKIVCNEYNNDVFYSSSLDGKIKFWCLQNESCLKTIDAYTTSIKELLVYSNGKFLVSCSDNNELKLWENEYLSNKCLNSKKINFNVSSIDHGSISSTLAAGGKELLLVEKFSLKTLRMIKNKNSEITKLKFNPVEYNILLSAFSTKKIKLFDTRLKFYSNILNIGIKITDLCWIQNRPFEFLFSGGDCKIYLFDIRNTRTFKQYYEGHTNTVQSISYEKRSNTIASACLDNCLGLFNKNFPSKYNLLHLENMGRINSISFFNSGEYFVTGGEDSKIRIWKNPYFNSKIYKFVNNDNRKNIYNNLSVFFFFKPKNTPKYVKRKIKFNKMLLSKIKTKDKNNKYFFY
ncbi:nucleolar snRNP protein [Guillardia theta]|uniref:Nucleolar snRNP protein n=1 Tax=Guillardia theta TaxID=55529 RepID=Q9AVZ3_GUITH|nr:nucleolar snRNP protein [Guillardia theta]CAC27078.1 nucleolar snRNP protein [Guillardia theta]|mmetsp:Transcript_4767/g.17341  ORF Transcript_4767/g.17341 Transcript_4767/m.17341 type:complete len:366 (-) Transcript_4767:90-1187(-)